mmetsp:Transcript_17554/g.51202  ORF Transcript_17554/g.51202 Transcript_17554/m.51202 type:complete len:398 (-) Transcript_17554:464-1657(-)
MQTLSHSTEGLVDKVPDPTSSPTATDRTSEDEDNSVDTDECFLEMLGFSAEECAGLQMANAEDDESDDRGISATSSSQEERAAPVTRRIDVPPRCSRYLHPPEECAAFVVEDFLTRDECDGLVEMGASLNGGFRYVTEAAHTSPDGTTHTVLLQNPNPHKLSVFEHTPTVEGLWRRLEGQVVPHIRDFVERTGCGPPLGLNPRLRVLRYDSGDNDRFLPHFDATTLVGLDKRSLLTVLVYLNDGGGVEFEGGETVYLDSVAHSSGEGMKIAPSAGKVVIFEHDLFHSGAPLCWGTKYVMRTDILFRDRGEETSEKMISAKNRCVEQDTPCSITDMCKRLQLSEEETQILDDIGLLEVTVESFLSPGITALKAMLGEGLGPSTIDLLVCEAMKIAKES